MIPELTEQGFPPESIARMLVNELRAAPQLRELVMRELLTDDFLELPQRMDRVEVTVKEFREEANSRMDEMRGDITEMRGDITEMRGDITEMRADIAEMRGDITEMRADITEMRSDINLLAGQVGNMRGGSYEDRCAEDINLVLVDYVDNPALADREEIRAALVQARRNGAVSRAQFDRARVVDIIASGVDLDSNQPVLAVVEASITLNERDVSAAGERAAILSEITGQYARPFCVANTPWSDDLTEVAGALGVTMIHFELPHFGAS